MQQLQDVREHTHRRDIGSGAGSLYDEGRLPVALRRERNDVVAPLRRRHRVRAGEFLEGGLRAPALEDADVPQDGAAAARALDACGNLAIVSREAREELLRE